MSTLKAITTVYSYYMPEIRDLITKITREYPHEVFLRSISPGLDDFHHPIIQRIIDLHKPDVPALSHFACRYPTSGSEEGIREYMTYLHSRGVRSIYFWDGDYEGYREVATSRGMEAIEIRFEQDPSKLEPGHWFLSNPSARNGNLIDRERILAILEAGHKVFYDLSYLGTTCPTVYDLDHPNIAVTALSFSKPYGLFYYRIGFTLSREPIPALYANKWFKNVYGLLIADAIIQELNLPILASKYKGLQKNIVDGINQELGLEMLPSDAYLLAYITMESAYSLSPEQQKSISRFKRGRNYRFCLTPYFLDLE